MALFKNDINSYIKDNNNSTFNAGKQSYVWYNEARNNRKDTSVEKVLPNENFQNGKLYHFRYNPINKDTLPWYDRYPLIISLGQIQYSSNTVEIGINLNMLPFDVKVFFIDLLYNDNKTLILEEISKVNMDKAKKQSGLNLSYDDLSGISNTLYLGFAVRNYLKSKMKAACVISYENWTKMILINEYFFSKITPAAVYSEYYKYIKNKNKK